MARKIFKLFKLEEVEENNEICIHAYAFDTDNQRVLLRIYGWNYDFYLELPDDEPWEEQTVDMVIDAIQDQFLYRNDTVTLKWKQLLPYYYYSKTKRDYIHVSTSNLKTFKRLRSKLRRPFHVNGIDSHFTVNIMSEAIMPIRKFLTDRNIENNSFVTAKVTEIHPNSRVTNMMEYEVEYDGIELYTGETPQIKCCVATFDIETRTDDYNSFPDAMLASNEIYLISYAIERVSGDINSRYSWIFSTRSPDCFQRLEDRTSSDVCVCDIVKCKDELSLIRAFLDKIADTDPDILVSYNGHSYDIPYIKDRLEVMYDAKLGCIGRRKDDQTDYVEPNPWQSSAYSYNEEKWFRFSGRICFDFYKKVRREVKLTKYTLSTVTEEYLKRKKLELPAKRQFEICDQGTDEEWELLLRYSLRDSVCLLDLFLKFNAWEGLSEMANVAHIGLEDIYTRGQQIRTMSCIYDLAHRKDYLVMRPDDLISDIDYEGAIVQEPLTGEIHDNVFVFDFSSLYPSIIIAFNICHTTYIKPGDTFNPEDVNEIEVAWPDGTSTVERFVKAHILKGVLPELLTFFLSARSKAKKDCKIAEKEGRLIDAVIYDSRQLAYKVCANSAYGFLGAKKGILPLIQAAASVTAMGRKLITKVANTVKNEDDAVVVYGDTDSVMIKIKNVPSDHKEMVAVANKLAGRITAIINRHPISIEFENVYVRFLVFTKKMYIAIKMNKETGEVLTGEKEVVYRGVAAARREHCDRVQKLYKDVVKGIMIDNRNMQEVYKYIDEWILDTLLGQAERTSLIMVRGIGVYAENSSYYMKTYLQKELERGRKYKPGERLSIVVTRTKPTMIQKDNTGERIRSADNADTADISIDTHYYAILNPNTPITAILTAVYGKTLPEKHKYIMKRNTHLPPLPSRLKYSNTEKYQRQQGTYFKFNPQRRHWLDEQLGEVCIPATLTCRHFDTWDKLIKVKEKLLEEVVTRKGSIRIPVSSSSKTRKKVIIVPYKG